MSSNHKRIPTALGTQIVLLREAGLKFKQISNQVGNLKGIFGIVGKKL